MCFWRATDLQFVTENVDKMLNALLLQVVPDKLIKVRSRDAQMCKI